MIDPHRPRIPNRVLSPEEDAFVSGTESAPPLAVASAMTRELLIQCGEVLYGPRWQAELARDLAVADRTLRRWAAGARPIPPGITAELARLLSERLDEIEATLVALRGRG